MGEAKRRKKLDPDYGKPKLIDELFKIHKELFKPRTAEGEMLLRYGLLSFFFTALHNDAPGVTMYDCIQGTADSIEIPWFQGTPVFHKIRFFALDDLVQVPKLSVEDINHLARETDFASNRITVIRLGGGSLGSGLISVFPVKTIQEELAKEQF